MTDEYRTSLDADDDDDKSKADVTMLSDEELAALQRSLEDSRRQIKEYQKAVGGEQERRALQRMAEAKVAGMSDQEKDELRKALGV